MVIDLVDDLDVDWHKVTALAGIEQAQRIPGSRRIELAAAHPLFDAERGESCNPMCSYEDEDIEAAFRKLDAALALHDPKRVGKLDIYFPLANFKDTKLPFIETFLARLKKDYIDTGKLQWGTQREVYEAYLAWNGLD